MWNLGYASISAALLAISLFYYYEYIFYTNINKAVRLFTLNDLQQYNGIENKEIYLALLGNVFDVTNGSKHYGPGQTYNIFVGRDASKNFITGKFQLDEVSDEVIGLTNHDLRSLNNWLKFYKKEYKKVGKLIGRYYTENGKLTPYGKEVKELIKQAEKMQENDELVKRQYPPCNVEWDAIKGSRVWCTYKSGGIERSWIGVPRQLYQPGSDSYRCACINLKHEYAGNIKEYENCAPDAPSCFVQPGS